MALTDEQKQKIEEEEYRKSIQDKNVQSSSRPSGQVVNVSNARVGKKKILIGLGIMFGGIFIMAVAGGNGSTNPFPIVLGVLGFIVGLGYMIVGKFQNWYHWR